MMPSYSDPAKAARDIFHSGLASIFFYVEDDQQENLYEILLRKCLPRAPRFKVFPLGGKAQVLKKAKESVNDGFAGRRIFLVDKDFDDLLNQKLSIPGLYYLDFYCIESTLIEEEALIEFAVDERPKLSRQQISDKLSFERTNNEWLAELDTLHRAFLLAQAHALDLKTTDLPPEFFSVSGKPSQLCRLRIQTFVESVKRELLSRGAINSDRQFNKLMASAFRGPGIKYQHINGKFLLSIWFHRLKQLGLASNTRIESLSIRLARYGKLSRLRRLTRRIDTTENLSATRHSR